MRIGISIDTYEAQSIWENGQLQSALNLAMTLRALPLVDEVLLLNTGSVAHLPASVKMMPDGQLMLLAPREATHLIDVVIEFGGRLDAEWLDYVRTLGKRVVFHNYAHPHAALVEPAIFNRPGNFTRADRCDAVWIFPRDAAFKPVLESLHRCPVHEVPYLWSPRFIEQREGELRAHGVTFGYRSRAGRANERRGLRAAIFASNASVTKSCAIPMLICDVAHRMVPEAIESMHVLNSIQMKEHMTFSFMTNSLDLLKAREVRFEGRHDFVGYMAQHADLVVTHQWDRDQYHLCLDALYGGYPVVHNARGFKTAGYYYPDFDVEAGAQRVLDAAELHDVHLEDYRREACHVMMACDPLALTNGRRYARELLALQREHY
ncbi:hypothetical protein BLA50215_07789 [Burkholderia lata]|uniref:DUF2827 family protein n=1 Tax=Burkholderia lata (strain ATCC 17760 / DSM 23089 / LMG 22485 / NCIMB 9086 / R18194 / 383) TaxID=482957 RepID=UPI001452CE81|nr:DUF2827 family protein [Burkholderia lata]VWD64014.1 hypothetical protein BLA50215_07789 [Burkholderia lata]